MCRIAGFMDFGYKGDYDVEDVIAKMRDALSYGGPDDAGLYVEKKIGLALGHRRLSILDLSPLGHQPMANDDQTLWVVYNGEIYNFQEIREELESCGYRFRSHTDTEVLLKAYEKWGVEALHKFRGMWAFALWDKKNQKLILCRDRVGVKPLYWYLKDNVFIFGSELKAFFKHPKFQKELDRKALSLYLQYGYTAAPYTIFKSTHKVEAGHYLELSLDQKISVCRYWCAEDFYLKGLEEREKWLKRSEEDVAEELEGILRDSFKLRLVADVPVGVFLSGGVDSSLVTALLQKEHSQPLKTFTIGFHEKDYNEAEWAKKIALHLGTDHTELYCTPKEAFEAVLKLPEIYDEPFGDASGIPTYLVSRLAREKVKASLSADGGDELFCGYTRYWLFGNFLKKLNRLPRPLRAMASSVLGKMDAASAAWLYQKTKAVLPKFSNFEDKYAKMCKVLKNGNSGDVYSQYFTLFSNFSQKDLSLLGMETPYALDAKVDFPLKERIDDFTKIMLTDFKIYLPDDLLTKVDRTTMSVALEGREPFLDHKLVEHVFQLPMEFKYKNGTSKHILRKILYKYVPKELIERPKQGFGVPVNLWFRNELRLLCKEYLDEKRIEKEGIFDASYVKKILDQFLQGVGADPYKLWFLFSFQLWKERWGC